MTDIINAVMFLLSKRDAASIAGRLPRPPKPEWDISGNTCIHVEDPFSNLASRREPCGRLVQRDGTHSWLCWLHAQKVAGVEMAPVISAGGEAVTAAAGVEVVGV